jgi:hypothetical protein
MSHDHNLHQGQVCPHDLHNAAGLTLLQISLRKPKASDVRDENAARHWLSRAPTAGGLGWLQWACRLSIANPRCPDPNLFPAFVAWDHCELCRGTWTSTRAVRDSRDCYGALYVRFQFRMQHETVKSERMAVQCLISYWMYSLWPLCLQGSSCTQGRPAYKKPSAPAVFLNPSSMKHPF